MYSLACTMGVFCLIVVASRLKAPLALAILGGAAVEAVLLVGASLNVARLLAEGPIQHADRLWVLLATVARMIAEGVVHPETLALLCVTSLQLVLSGSMQAGGQMERIVSLARQFLRRPAVTMAALPAMIGLLPMPGGALVSAPMVQSAAGEHPVEPSRLSAINYWYRHIWEHWWPLYPGILLAVSMTKSSFLDFARYQSAMGLIMVLAGLWIFRGTSAGLHRTLPPPPRGTKRRLLWAGSSIWIIIVLWLPAWFLARLAPLDRLGDAGKTIERFGPMGLGLVAAVVWTVFLNRLKAGTLKRIVLGRPIWTVAGLVISVMVFKHVIDATQAAQDIAAGLQQVRVGDESFRLTVVVAVLPFVAGAVTGLAFGFVGVSFPIVVPLMAGVARGGSIVPYVALAYAFGHLGQMISPLHLCQVVSNRYFNTPFGPVYRHFVPSWLMLAGGTVAYVFLLWIIVA